MNNEYKRRMEEMQQELDKAKSEAKQCSHCGYCPHCGRSNFAPYQYPYYPNYPYWTVYSGTIGGQGAITTIGGQIGAINGEITFGTQ